MKFRVFPFMAFAVAVLDILSLSFLCIVIFSNSPTEPWLWVLISIMCIAFPTFSSIYFFSFSLDIIMIDDSGVKKYHFGKLKKTIAWDKIVTAKVCPNNEMQGTIVLSDFEVNYNFFSGDLMYFDKKSICLKYSKEAALEIEKHLGRKLM